MTEYLADVVVAVALALATAFAVTAFLGFDAAAAWLAAALAIAGIVRLGVILVEALSPDY